MRRFVLIWALLLCAGSAAAQDTVAVRDTVGPRVAPSTALMRSLLVPGWGQFSVGATKRGVFFVALQGTSYYMLARTLSRLGDAEDHEAEQVALARDSILALEDTSNLQLRIDSVDAVIGARSLVNSRERQRQDWIAYTLFFTFASGIDAFVAAHLADFPAQIDAEPRAQGGMELRFSVPLPTRRRW